jgi:adenylate cyclase
MLLALVIGLGATVFVNHLFGQADEVRFLRQLRDSGQQATDEVVRFERRLLEIERAIANTEGIPEAIALGDAEALRDRVLSLAFNADVDVAVVLDREGTSLLAVRRSSPDAPQGDYLIIRSEGFYRDWPFVQQVLRLDSQEEASEDQLGNKRAGLHSIRLGDEEEHVLFVAGPLMDEEGRVFGAVLVGEYLRNFVLDLKDDVRASISVYDSASGRLIETTFGSENALDPPGLVLTEELIATTHNPGETDAPYRSIQVDLQTHGEVLTPLQVRQGTQELGILGISLVGEEDQELVMGYQENAVRVIQVGAIALVLVVFTGLMISHTITRPLVDIAEASAQVATGNLNTRVIEGGFDEVGVLARTFNTMIDGLREGAVYRDLLGRTVTPEIRDQLRGALAKGGVLLEGQTTKATILFADLQGFTTMAEGVEPTLVMQTLNEYFSGIVPIVARHGGVVNKFDNDAIMAFFGILPRRVPPQVSALQATHAGMEILDFVKRLSERRDSDGLPSLGIGIGISTGSVIAGGLGTADRLHYTVIGDAVNISQRIQQTTSEAGSGNLVISEDTYDYLASARDQFEFGRRGRAQLRGYRREVIVHEVTGRWSRLVDCSDVGEAETPPWADGGDY